MTDKSIADNRADLFAFFDQHNIAHETMDHPAFFTVEEGRDFKQQMPGGHSKNLFVKDKKGNLTLAVVHADTRVDLVALGKTLGAKGRFSFAKAELMEQVLGVTPGSVTPFALINDSDNAIAHVVIDEAFMTFEKVWFHPLQNTASTAISPQDLLQFVKLCGHEPKLMSLMSD